MWDLIVSVPDHCSSFYFPENFKLAVTAGITFNTFFSHNNNNNNFISRK